jgi:hypothetical protein
MDPFTPAPIDPFADGVPAWNAQLEQQMHGRDDDEDDDDQDDDDEPDEDDADDDQEDEDDDDDLDGLSEADLRKELAKTRKALKTTSRADARKRVRLKKELAATKAQLDKGGKPEDKPKPKGAATEAGVTRAEIDERDAAREKQHTRDLIESRFEAKLREDGVSEANIELVLDRIDYDSLDYSRRTRAVEGMDDEIERLKGRYPAVFTKSTGKTRRQDAADDRGDKGSRRPKPKTASERQAAALVGR